MDMARVRQRKRDIVDSFRGGSEQPHRGDRRASTCCCGEARFTGPKTLDVRLNDGGTRADAPI